MDAVNYPSLSQISSPHDLRRFPSSALERVAAELRTYLIDTVGQNGGHFAAGLGAVELAVACTMSIKRPTTD
jgi:1-deoxy-D-xylulose-5-phosphate synthase